MQGKFPPLLYLMLCYTGSGQLVDALPLYAEHQAPTFKVLAVIQTRTDPGPNTFEETTTPTRSLWIINTGMNQLDPCFESPRCRNQLP